MISNQEIAKILSEMADFYEMQEAPFKPRAYERAAESVAALDEPVAELYQEKGLRGLLAISGVGRGIALHLEELLHKGKLKKYEEMKKRFPVQLTELRSLPGVGPKTISVLYQKLKVRSLKDLEKAAKAHKISKLRGFGPGSEAKILKSINFRKAHSGRFLLGQVVPVVRELVGRLENSGFFRKLKVGGSFRRMQETVGDIDILAIAKHPQKAIDFFVQIPDMAEILQKGETKSEIRLKNGLQVDLRIVSEDSWGAALQYFTGDKSHNVALRKIAIAKGYKLSEYGLFRGKKMIAGRTEEEVYKRLGLAWIPPELRTETGEIEAARRQARGKKPGLPKVINYGDVRGDLQVQTSRTDGTASIEEMAKAAHDLGLEYICITDHTKSLYMTGGLDEKKLLQQMKEIDRLNSKFNPSTGSGQKSKFRILKGAEVNILKDGSLDIADDVLVKLDVVGVSVHSHFKLSREEMTARIVRAISNPHVDILFHPTTRVIQQRDPIDFDFAEILKVAKKNKVALEIDAYPDRLDIHDTLIREAVEAGVKLVIDSDAHHVGHLQYLYLGEGQARRGWATKNDILNTKPVEGLLKYFAKK